jgi:acetyl esterase/lipase
LPHASHARGALAGYPPTLIVSGMTDPLVDDNQVFDTHSAGQEPSHTFRVTPKIATIGFKFSVHPGNSG